MQCIVQSGLLDIKQFVVVRGTSGLQSVTTASATDNQSSGNETEGKDWFDLEMAYNDARRIFFVCVQTMVIPQVLQVKRHQMTGWKRPVAFLTEDSELGPQSNDE